MSLRSYFLFIFISLSFSPLIFAKDSASFYFSLNRGSNFSGKKRPIRFSYFHIGGAQVSSLEEGSARYSSYNSLTASTYLKNGNRLSMTGAMAISTSGQDRFSRDSVESFEMELIEIYSQYRWKKFGIPNTLLTVSPSLRVSLPLSKSARLAKERYGIEARIYLARPLTYRQWLYFSSFAEYKNFTYNGYITSFNRIRGNKFLETRQSLSWNYTFSQTWSLELTEALVQKRYLAVPSHNLASRYKEYLRSDMTINYRSWPVFLGLGFSTGWSDELSSLSVGNLSDLRKSQLTFKLSYLF